MRLYLKPTNGVNLMVPKKDVKKAETSKKSKKSRNVTVKVHKAMIKISSSKARIHVVSHKDGWAVKKEGSNRASGVFEKKITAVNRAKNLAKKGPQKDVVIHKKDGTIQEWDKVKK